MRRCLCPDKVGINEVDLSVNNAIADGVFHEWRWIRDAPEPLQIALVFSEEHVVCAFTRQMVNAKRVMGGFDRVDVRVSEGVFVQTRLPIIAPPAPGIAEPNRGKYVQGRAFGPAVGGGDANQNIVGRGFGVLDLNVEKPILPEQAGVPKFEFGIEFPAGSTLPNEFLVGKCSLRIAVQHRHVTV